MGFFADNLEALASLSFKTASDGSRLFYPLSHWGSGYVIASDREPAR
jgi:hypothetical protein